MNPICERNEYEFMFDFIHSAEIPCAAAGVPVERAKPQQRTYRSTT
jgi:hypothetical protein